MPNLDLNALIAGLGPVGAAVVILGAWWIYNNRQAAKRSRDEDSQPNRGTTSFLLEKFADVDRHVRSTREEVQEVAIVSRELSKTAERQEGRLGHLEDRLGRTHDICLEALAILKTINGK